MGTKDNSRPITLGILGGGQLGMMSAEAAAKRGVQIVIWAQSEREPAVKLVGGGNAIIAPFSDPAALEEFLSRCDFVTTEFENVPLDVVRACEQHKSMSPSSHVMEIASHRWREKQFFHLADMPTVRTIHIQQGMDLPENELADFTFPGILKTATLGYDGKGQLNVSSLDELRVMHAKLDWKECVLEERIELACEFSIIAVRDRSDQVITYLPIENKHEYGILRHSTFPGPHVPFGVGIEADTLVQNAVRKIDLCGELVFEFMISTSGELFTNEMAPRPHNSGHGTIEGCVVSQFEQHVRVSCGLPLLDPSPIGPWEMENLIGTTHEEMKALRAQLSPGSTLHDYGKDQALPGRKMGHVTTLLLHQR